MTDTPENTPHEYEPGESTSPMHTEPLCAVCGLSARAAIHEKGSRG